MAETAGGAVRQPRHHVHGAGQRRAAVHPGDDLRAARRRSRPADRGLPAAAAVPAQHRRALPRAAARRRGAARRRCRVLADALEIGTPDAAQDARASTGSLARTCSTTLERLRRGPAWCRGHQAACTTRSRRSSPTLAFLTPAQTTCNYVTLWFRNIASLLSEGDTNGTWQRFIIIATPQGPNNEGGPSSAPANGPERRATTCTRTATRTPRRRARPRSARRATRTTTSASQSIGNVPGNQGTKTERPARRRTGAVRGGAEKRAA